MEIRGLRGDDIETLVDDLWVPFAEEMAALDSYNSLADDVRESAVTYRRDRLGDDDVATFVADSEGTVVGYTVVVYGESPPVFARGPEANVEEVYVAPDSRGQGVATRLLTRAEEWAGERGCERVTLSVNRRNDAAVELYESSGYSVRRYRMDKRLDCD